MSPNKGFVPLFSCSAIQMEEEINISQPLREWTCLTLTSLKCVSLFLS